MSSKTWNGNFAHNLRLIKGQFFVENYGLYYCVTQNLLFGCLEFVSFLFASRIKKGTFLNDYFRKPKNPCTLRSVQISVSVGKYPKVDFLNILLRDRLWSAHLYTFIDDNIFGLRKWPNSLQRTFWNFLLDFRRTQGSKGQKSTIEFNGI